MRRRLQALEDASPVSPDDHRKSEDAWLKDFISRLADTIANIGNKLPK
ncbi:MAG: hypothetical protein JWP84_2572 [Tardiphaga sp.]|nr:hypothetical protein [Tardiphaga sp.]